MNDVETSIQASPDGLIKTAVAPVAWDKFGTKIVSMRFISVHICSLTVRLQPEYNVIVISNFQLSSLIGQPTENPCVGGSIPSLATFQYNHLQNSFSQPLAIVP
jgi:hypothetical protein